MTPYRTIFAVTVPNPSAARSAAITSEIKDMDAPFYATEAEVTQAVALNKIPFTEINRAYRLAKEYQLYLKAKEREANSGRRRKLGAPVRCDKAMNFLPGYARVDFSPAKG